MAVVGGENEIEGWGNGRGERGMAGVGGEN